MYFGQTGYYLAIEVAFNTSCNNDRHSYDGRLACSLALLLARLQFHPSSTGPFDVIIKPRQKTGEGGACKLQTYKVHAIRRVIDGKLHLIRELVSMKCQLNRQNLLSQGGGKGWLSRGGGGLLEIKINHNTRRMMLLISETIVQV